MQVVLPLDRFRTRLASVSDLPAICAIEDDSFSTPYSPSLLQRLLKDCREGFLVVTDQTGELVGYCVCAISNRSAHLISIAVHRNFRRIGIATKLLQSAIEHLTAHAVDELWLEVNLKNFEAVTLYAKLGFKETSVLKKYYSDGSDAARMHLILRESTRNPAKGGG